MCKCKCRRFQKRKAMLPQFLLSCMVDGDLGMEDTTFCAFWDDMGVCCLNFRFLGWCLCCQSDDTHGFEKSVTRDMIYSG